MKSKKAVKNLITLFHTLPPNSPYHILIGSWVGPGLGAIAGFRQDVFSIVYLTSQVLFTEAHCNSNT